MYCANRFLNLFFGFVPELFLKNHLNDLCGGIIFPAYVDLLLIFLKSPYHINGWKVSIAIGLICAISWEIIAPLFLPYSTGDWIDAILYVIGSLIYASLKKIIIPTE